MKKLKTMIVLILSAVILISVCACGSDGGAKDAFKPPAEAFNVTIEGDDEPVIDGVAFTYDSKARINTVSYSIDSYDYKQEYAYDTDQVVIKTLHKSDEINEKVIKYNDFPVESGFTCVDGYIIRVTEDMPRDASANHDTEASEKSDETDAPKESDESQKTDEPAEDPTDPPTDPPTEDVQKAANLAYYEYLTSHSSWFEGVPNGFSGFVKGGQVAFSDLNADGISEMLILKPTDETGSFIGFSILTYENAEVTELYDDQLIGIPGQGPTYNFFFDEDSKLYSLASNNSAKIIRYDVDGNSVSAKVLGELKATGSSPGDPRYYYLDGKETTAEVFQDFYLETTQSAATYLFAFSVGGNSPDSLSMSYDEACAYLSDN